MCRKCNFSFRNQKLLIPIHIIGVLVRVILKINEAEMNILISGATGFIGTSLVPLLQSKGHHITAVVRQVDNRLDQTVAQYTLDSLTKLDKDIDVFINLAGGGIADKPWSEKRKEALIASRTTLTQKIKHTLKRPPQLVISMSAIGYYGSHTNAVFDEYSDSENDFSHELCAAWESAATEFSDIGCRTVIFRLGVVLGAYGGALNKMRPSYKLGLGGKIGSGEQWFSWVHLADVLKAITESLSDERYEGVYNLTSPHCVKQKVFAQHYARSLKRPAFFTIPAFVLRAIFGEMASLLTNGAKIIPKRLIHQGFHFEHSDLKEALIDIENNRPS